MGWGEEGQPIGRKSLGYKTGTHVRLSSNYKKSSFQQSVGVTS